MFMLVEKRLALLGVTLAHATQLGPDKIVAAIAAGGMGGVYRALDSLHLW